MAHLIFILLLLASLFVSPALALFMGIFMAMVQETPCAAFSKKTSKYLLQAAVVGLGFGMNLHESLAAGKEGILMTIVSVAGVMVLGCLMGRQLGLPSKISYLIASGTAICGGSAIAAVAPVVKADSHETSVSLAVIFTLNALALFIFPPLGQMLGMSGTDFGLWSAIAIHDTSSVVGAAATYGEEALNVATTVKLTRALWIIPLSLVSILIFMRGNKEQGEAAAGISIPWFILFFIVAMVINTYVSIPQVVSDAISLFSHKALSVTLFLIGSALSVDAVRKVGARPVLLGVLLWGVISATSLAAILVW